MMRAGLMGILLLAACAPAPQAREPLSARLPAPTPAEIGVRIGADKAGETVAVKIGERFAVELVGVPTAGYVWAPARLPDFLIRAGEASGPTTAAQNQPGFAGGNHWEVFLFAAAGPGRGDLVLEQRRPWETDEPAAATFTVTIEAQ